MWSKGIYIPSLHFFSENNPEPWPVFFFVHWQMKTSFSITILGSLTSENNCSGHEGAKVLDICTTLIGLPDLASDVSPLFAEPMFLFGWALCNTSTYYVHVNLLTELRESCSAWGISITPETLTRYFYTHCFGYPELIFPLKTSFPIILFRFLETNVC